MEDETRLRSAVEALNELLPAVTPYKLAVVDPNLVEHIEKNAHFMPKRTYDQLVDNIAKDGNLSTLPFCWRKADGVFVCLSGNHRLDAARAAKVPAILILYTDKDLSRSEQIAIQLSHNALVGKDNFVTLSELWREIDEVRYKVYSGLDDKLLDALSSVNVARLSSEPLRFEEIRLQFVTPELARIQEVVKTLGAGKPHKFLADVAHFDRFFDALLDFKEVTRVYNSSTAFLLMVEVVEDWIAQERMKQDALKQSEPEEPANEPQE